MKNKMYLCNKSYLDFTKGKVDEKLNKDSKEYIFIDDEGDETWINMSKSNFTLIELLNTTYTHIVIANTDFGSFQGEGDSATEAKANAIKKAMEHKPKDLVEGEIYFIRTKKGNGFLFVSTGKGFGCSACLWDDGTYSNRGIVCKKEDISELSPATQAQKEKLWKAMVKEGEWYYVETPNTKWIFRSLKGYYITSFDKCYLYEKSSRCMCSDKEITVLRPTTNEDMELCAIEIDGKKVVKGEEV
jgi:hypothetical protein